MEDTTTSGQTTDADTETASTETGQNNNADNDSQVDQTDQNGTPKTVPYSRFKEVLDKTKTLEDQLKKTVKPEQATQTTGSDDEWKKKIELDISLPSYLKDKEDDMVAYWTKNPNMTKQDVIKIFTPVDKLAEQAKAADEAAQSIDTGGTSSPAARIQTEDIKKMKSEDLDAEVKRLAEAGEFSSRRR